ncbi:hypothetical protein SAMN02745207_00406 [Clostridium grantii DSM 8605]|uniref:Sel1 repeat family protein n=1 Tax=Clostridium grantii DSM 8605 TaxID=1121316 RepID=A0A1M5R049_9CLOT|nr:hypothetical protein SAMN02745207_00406 [Clostridium grantii DSM 8605]
MLMCDTGIGVEQYKLKAIKLYNRAANQDHVIAQSKLGYMFYGLF